MIYQLASYKVKNVSWLAMIMIMIMNIITGNKVTNWYVQGWKITNHTENSVIIYLKIIVKIGIQ